MHMHTFIYRETVHQTNNQIENFANYRKFFHLEIRVSRLFHFAKDIFPDLADV